MRDPLLAAMCGREDVLGLERHQEQDKGKALAGKSTLNRLELGAHKTNARTKKIEAHADKIELRLWFSTFAYLLMRQVRAVALSGTRLARATVGTIRLQLMKIAAQVTVSVRRVQVRLCSACPLRDVFAHAHGRLRALS